MNISTVETRTGLTRANIRYYEAEGLLQPDRLPNGYRDYTDGHVETLKKIKLLRQLRVPLEEIKNIQQGEASLSDALGIQADRLASETQQLENARRICRDTRPWRAAAFVGTCAAAAGLIARCLQYARLPLHRGDLTVSEFNSKLQFLSPCPG